MSAVPHRHQNKPPTTEFAAAHGFQLWHTTSQPNVMPAAHTHPDVEINWIETGSVEYLLAGKRGKIEPGFMGIFWGGMPHQLVASPPKTQGIWLTLPLAWFFQCRLPNRLVAQLMNGGLILKPMSWERLGQWLADFTNGAAGKRLVLLELEALFGRIALSLAADSPPVEHFAVPLRDDADHMARITAYMAGHYREELDITAIANVIGLHPKYLMAVFKRMSGMTVKTYLMGLRLAHAQRLLATTRMNILNIALDSGFGSLGPFYAAFTCHCGQTPSHYRRQHYF